MSYKLFSMVREIREFREFKEFKETFRYLNHSYHSTKKSCIIEGILGGGVLSEARILCVCKREQNFSNAKFTDYTAFFYKKPASNKASGDIIDLSQGGSKVSSTITSSTPRTFAT